jgi:peptide/nickel transport system permease protein
MLDFLIRRALLALGVVCGTAVAVFLLLYVIPGDPVTMALGPRATQAARAAYIHRAGLDRSLVEQLWLFLARLASGDLGTDIWSGRSVATLVGAALPYTVALAVTGLGWAVVLGIGFGCLAAGKRRWLDRIVALVSIAFIAVPPFLVAIYCLLVFAVTLHWFPAIGAGEPGDLASQAWALVLPSLAVGLGWVGYIARLVRASLLEVLQEKHIETARAFGLSERVILFRYALPIAIVPVISVIGIGFGALLSGSVFAEIVFARPGIGRLVYQAILERNYPVASGAIVVTASLYAGAMLLTDLAIALLDPRSRAAL